jgi:hypothetical protein
MQGTIRPFAMTGVAIVGAGVIAMTPMAPPLHDVQIAQPVQLSAASDVFAPDPSTLDGAHRNFYNLLPILKALPAPLNIVKISPSGQQLVNFSTTSLSGLLLGLVGPLAAPVVVAAADIDKIGHQEVAAALATLLNIPADMVSAFLFGGAHLDVTALVTALGPALGLQFPPGIKVGINFGGLLSPSGSAFNSLDLNLASLAALGLPIPVGADLATGNPAGAIASLGAVIQVFANGVAHVAQFDLPAFGQLFGNVVGALLNNALKGLGLGGLTAPGGLLGGLGGLLGLAAPAKANAVPASVQKSLAAVTTDSKATASDDAPALSAKATRVKTAPVVKVDTTAKSSATPTASFGSQVSAAAAGFGASTTKGPLKTAKHAKAAASSSKAGAGAK